jgi:luciferase-like monooxygenase
MHTHGSSHLDIRLSKEDQERMLREGKAEPHRFAPQAGWVSFRIRSEGDVEIAKELIRLSYDNAGKMIAAHMSRRIQKGDRVV